MNDREEIEMLTREIKKAVSSIPSEHFDTVMAIIGWSTKLATVQSIGVAMKVIEEQSIFMHDEPEKMQ